LSVGVLARLAPRVAALRAAFAAELGPLFVASEAFSDWALLAEPWAEAEHKAEDKAGPGFGFGSHLAGGEGEGEGGEKKGAESGGGGQRQPHSLVMEITIGTGAAKRTGTLTVPLARSSAGSDLGSLAPAADPASLAAAFACEHGIAKPAAVRALAGLIERRLDEARLGGWAGLGLGLGLQGEGGWD